MASHSHERSTFLKRTFFVILFLACSQINILNAAEESETETVLVAPNSAVESQTTVEIAARNSPSSADVANSDSMLEVAARNSPSSINAPSSESDYDLNSDSMLKVAARNSPSSTNAPSLESDYDPDSDSMLKVAARNSPSSTNAPSSESDYDPDSDSMFVVAARNLPSSANVTSSDSVSKPDQMPEPILGRSFHGRFFKRLFRPQEIKNETSSSITNHNNTTNSEDQNNSLLLKIVEATVNKILKNIHKLVGDYNQAGTKPYIYTLIHNILFALVWVGKRIIKLIKFLIDFYKKIKGI